MARAAAMESVTHKNPVTPGEVLTARELYADMLLELGRYTDAIEQYEISLERTPGRFNSLCGAGRSAELNGDNALAARYFNQLVAQVSEDSSPRQRLEHARKFTNEHEVIGG